MQLAKGVKTGNVRIQFRSLVNWQRALKQKGVRGTQ